MTAQEAIDILRNSAWLGSDADRERTEEAVSIAAMALEWQVPKKPKTKHSQCTDGLLNLFCPTCGNWVGMWNIRLEMGDMYNNSNGEICPYCGQVIDTEVKV